MKAAGEVGGAAAEEARAWTEVFTLFQQAGRDDRGAAYAMSMGALRRKCEDLDLQLEAARFQEQRLLHFARSEMKVDDTSALAAADAASEAARTFGRELAGSLCTQVRSSRGRDFVQAKPWQAALMADDAHEEASDTLERQQKEQEELDIRTKAQAKAEAAALAEAEEKIEREVGEQTRTALASQGLNSKRLPLRPGLPPCGFFMRKGTCKRGKSCMWDHPEPDLNSSGYPLRPGQLVCALYRRTRTCKFGLLCMYDHPELPGDEPKDQPGMLPLALAKVAAQQHQLQLLLHLQLLQEMDMMQDPEAMMNAWVRFRITFSLNG
uniref:C3H1-type domain-containing protein n=1 Tax=Zooxanthella nutricula TaxID=1333877 RepID=A0A7S2NUL1_9DINO|mmetsp:Transcript_37972/g.114766  ORF Transcript_37972/g.114766 Transcript_37972/m.114766 type:complete len:323 (+) Transcript_37972:1-969(+)